MSACYVETGAGGRAFLRRGQRLLAVSGELVEQGRVGLALRGLICFSSISLVFQGQRRRVRPTERHRGLKTALVKKQVHKTAEPSAVFHLCCMFNTYLPSFPVKYEGGHGTYFT